MKQVRLDIDGPLARLTLAAPSDLNRLGAAMFADLSAAVDELSGRKGLRALLLDARGDHFCVGGAIDEFAAAPSLAGHLAETLPHAHAMILKLAELPFPVVTALRGAVAGGGIGLALCADIVLADTTCVFRAGYPGIGLSPDLGTSWQLMRRAGPAFAAEFLMSNRRMDAMEALERGILSAVFAPEDLDREAVARFEDLAQGPTVALAAVRRLMAGEIESLRAHLAGNRN